jgi:hypothetical protein
MLINVTVMLTYGFNADPDLDQAFYLYADADPDPGSQINAYPCESEYWTDFKVTKS